MAIFQKSVLKKQNEWQYYFDTYKTETNYNKPMPKLMLWFINCTA